jgi:UDP:flavonoid glycosyltransferase YjiC (YdhE family)
VARILLTTFGSLGDLRPLVAVGRALADRGHAAVLATHGAYRQHAERAGLEFRAVRPDLPDFGPPEGLRRALDARRGGSFVVRRMVMPFLRAGYEDLLAASAGCDVVVGHTLTFAAPIVAERRRVPFVQTVLQPFTLFSAHDPPVLSGVPGARWLARRGPAVWVGLRAAARAWTRTWLGDVAALRAAAGLPPTRRHPLLESPPGALHLALFSPLLAAPRPDWPRRTLVTGYPAPPRATAAAESPPGLPAFLDDGPAPLVFTLGSSGVWDPGRFFHEAAAAARLLRMRAVLLTGPVAEDPARGEADGIFTARYAPHTEVFPRAAAVVHQGGIGTTGEALRAGRPMLVVPFSHDQPDNAERCARLGVARVLPRAVRARRLATALADLLADAALQARAKRVGEQVRAEDGARVAAAAIERELR